nr:MAG TPA: hypothetical protein [Caudoviricetes sp.]DAM20150.1 MAG TPA: hypothetical protein [Caudoviricetes sp.]DAZ45778.1 MAG TPA: hypothetical protein [Caudoviricetes sp.]
MRSITTFWTGAACRRVWRPPLLQVCRRAAAVCCGWPGSGCL